VDKVDRHYRRDCGTRIVAGRDYSGTHALVERGYRVDIEDPQYNGTREVLRAAGARLLPVPVDRDGLNPAKLPDQASLVFVTPSHQFPTGAILPLARRLELWK
jgi:GntR family transcriptional regulator/MocR family aminotransferase